ncbi:MAG: N-acetyltransferase family protein [Pseudomonadota bacterium]
MTETAPGTAPGTDPRRPAPAPLCRSATAPDGPAISRIHAEGLATGHASFRETPYAAADAWRTAPPGLLRVAVLEGEVAAWAGVTPTSDRCTYAGVGEASLYVAAEARGRGLGALLLTDLVAASETAGFWTLIAQIFPENTASLALFRRHGFATLGTRRRLGRMSYGPRAGQWRDVVALERRSPTVGIDTP